MSKLHSIDENQRCASGVAGENRSPANSLLNTRVAVCRRRVVCLPMKTREGEQLSQDRLISVKERPRTTDCSTFLLPERSREIVCNQYLNCHSLPYGVLANVSNVFVLLVQRDACGQIGSGPACCTHEIMNSYAMSYGMALQRLVDAEMARVSRLLSASREQVNGELRGSFVDRTVPSPRSCSLVQRAH